MMHKILSRNEMFCTTERGLREETKGKIIAHRYITSSNSHEMFLGDFWGCILWTSKIKTKMNTETAWWNHQATIRSSSCRGVTDENLTVVVI